MGSGASRKLEMNVRGTDSISSVSTSCSEPGSGAGSGDPLALCVAKGNVPNELLQKAALRLIRTEPNSRFSIPQMNSAPPTRGVPLKYLAACPEVSLSASRCVSPLKKMGNQLCGANPHAASSGSVHGDSCDKSWVHEMSFPMYLVKISDFLQMRGTPKDHAFLLQEDLLHQWQPGMFVLFVSHQWLSRLHPDPGGQQMEVLRLALEGLMDGSLRLSLDGYWVFFVDETHTTHELRTRLPEGYLWFDWFGVPQAISRTRVFDEEEDDVKQAEAAKAVDSIPAYVERCNLFVILAPELFHRDTGMICNSTSWQLRGWCISELLCQQLSNKPDTTIITLHSARHAELNSWQIDWDAVSQSHFTVEEDRLMVSELVRKSVAMKIQHESQTGSLAYFRYLVTGQFKLARSQERSTNSMRSSWTSSEFLRQFHFSSLQEAAQETSSMPGLLCAVLSGDVQMIRTLVESMADVNLRCYNLEKICRQPSGHTPLMIAARWKQDPAVLQTLIELRADLTAGSRFGSQVAHWVQLPGQVQVLAAAKVDLESMGCFRHPPLVSVACWAGPDTVAEMIAKRCEVNPTNAGVHPLHSLTACSKRQSVEKAQLLLEHRADVDAQVSTAGTGIFACMCHSSQMISNMSDFGSLSAATKLFGSLEGITPLGMAAFFGDHSLTRCLLEAGADRSIANARGDLPVMLASAQGHQVQSEDRHH
ncbi:Serine/threonine-protein phosphatase 6 regulatory ankyrin repeat subunit B (PP6-ARS-B) (Serine/threonine-protein phosphatase 6 regulatory subunit ARS-B) (Ankyrin repeat domain-containing protein 44) [Durusdinium trenchii]|uniref:Serine/threonine-protein phosphatase 6 regulatory ankyrin repeat subunit B (PP6-ARS-B) (Serine/threonine-protein phosphatase 6 regulatory subunit ARS-B) (Ankyrin repeat domain-containing protein 44) n=1 Tax=Durusdinium trenchii TaxID=1381693 RepID=A0ABP0SPW3_9DINO